MFDNNNQISKKQFVRMGIIDNIAVGIFIVPYIASFAGGDYSVIVLIGGIIVLSIYGLIMYWLSSAFKEGYIEELNQTCKGLVSIVIDVIYAFRFLIKGSYLTILLMHIIKAYLLYEFNPWAIIVPFVLVCGYGAVKDIEKRGRLIEFLFWWIVIPILTVASFAIPNIVWEGLIKGAEIGNSFEINNIFWGSYGILLITSTLEFILLSVNYVNEKKFVGVSRILVSISAFLIGGYIFSIGILGRAWVNSDAIATINVMEAGALPKDTIGRFDFAVLGFWIIGIFAVVSGYLFYAKRFIEEGISNKQSKGKRLILLVLMTWMLGMIWGSSKFSISISKIFSYYALVDIILSIIIPIIIIIIGKRSKNLKKVTSSGMVLILLLGLTGCNIFYKENASIELRDYVLKMDIERNEENTKYKFSLTVADLAEYSGKPGEGGVKEKDIEYQCNTFNDLLDEHKEKSGKTLDVGHIEEINIKGSNLNDLFVEMSSETTISKSVMVKSENEEKTLRAMIKDAYQGQ